MYFSDSHLFVWNPNGATQLLPCCHNDQPVIAEPFCLTAILLLQFVNHLLRFNTHLLIKRCPRIRCIHRFAASFAQRQKVNSRAQVCFYCTYWIAGLYTGGGWSHFASFGFCSLWFTEWHRKQRWQLAKFTVYTVWHNFHPVCASVFHFIRWQPWVFFSLGKKRGRCLLRFRHTLVHVKPWQLAVWKTANENKSLLSFSFVSYTTWGKKNFPLWSWQSHLTWELPKTGVAMVTSRCGAWLWVAN